MPPHFLDAFKPDLEPLMRAIMARIDDGMLREIAAADYGMDADKHLSPLMAFRDKDVLPSLSGWHPSEVLELIRWSEPDDPNWQPSGRGDRGHWMRAFASATMLYATKERCNIAVRDHTTINIARLLLSLERLPHDFGQAPLQFVAWLVGDCRDDASQEQGLLGVALLSSVLRHAPETTDGVLVAIAQWIADREQETANTYRNVASVAGADGKLWLLDWQYKADDWHTIGRFLAQCDLAGRGGDAVVWVRTIADLLMPFEESPNR